MFLCPLPNSKSIKFRLWGIRIKQCGSIWFWYSTKLLHFLQRFVVLYLRSSLLWSRLSVAIEFGRLSSTSTCTVCCSVSAFRRLSSSSSSTCIGCSASACLSSSLTWTCMFQLLKLVVSRYRLVLLVVFQLLKLAASSRFLIKYLNIV